MMKESHPSTLLNQYQQRNVHDGICLFFTTDSNIDGINVHTARKNLANSWQ